MLCTAVVVFCHSVYPVMGRFMLRAQDQNMTNGDFAFFTFYPLKDPFTDTLWNSYYDEKDAQQHRRLFNVVKQVRAAIVTHLVVFFFEKHRNSTAYARMPTFN